MKVFSREDIFEMAEQGESNLLEFKEAKNKLPNSFWTTYSSFSNTGTGTVLLGIKENEDSNEIVGVNQCNKIIKSLITECNNTNKVSFSSLTDDQSLKLTTILPLSL